MISDIGTNKPVIVLGAGGHAKVVIEALRLSGRNVLGFTNAENTQLTEILGARNLGNDDVILDYSPGEVILANGVGALPGSNTRRELNRRMRGRGYRFTGVVHPSAIVSSDVRLEEGVQIMAGAVIQPGVSIGRSCIVNTGVNIDHDCCIEDDCLLSPGVTLSGNVTVSERTYIGTGALVIQGIAIGNDCIIAAGSIIYKDIPAYSKYIQTREEQFGKVT